MHASSLPAAWHRWRDGVAHAFQPHPAHFDDSASHRLADNPIRARIRQVRLLPLIVPGMAVLLVCCVALIGSILRP